MDNPLSLLWIAILFIVTLVILFSALKFSVRKDKDEGKATHRISLHLGQMRGAFRSAVELIERNITARPKRYDIPWVVLMHEKDDGTGSALERAGISRVLAPDHDIDKEAHAPNWHFFDRGIVISLESNAALTAEGELQEERSWEAFLALCGHYRPQRPLDSIVVSIPVNLLLDQSPTGREELKRRANLASRRIWIAQNHYAMRFAVYVLISGGEHLACFSEFAAALPQSMRQSMLGWSSPYQPTMLYQPDWVTQAFDQMEQSVATVSAELFASDVQLHSPSELFLLPSRLAELREGMSTYVDELMRANAYHEPFFLRGMYLYGATQEPVFLRDVIEKKVFAEFGLSRAAHSQRLARPIMSRISRWSAIAVLSIFSVGLIVSTIQLQRVFPVLAEGIDGLNRDRQFRAEASSKGETIEFEWYRKTALSLMIGLEQLQAKRFNDSYKPTSDSPRPINPFMPGSWPIFDDLFVRAYKRIEQEFAELAVSTIQKSLYRRTAELTHAPLNPVSNTLAGGADNCSAPGAATGAFNLNTEPSIDIETLPEFTMLSRFLAEMKRLDANVLAMQSLKTPTKTSQADIHELVLDALGADVPGDLTASIALFRNVSINDAELIDKSAISLAARCSFLKGSLALNQKMFENNALITSEMRIIDAKNAVLTMFHGSDMPTSADMLTRYRALLDAIKNQKTLLEVGDNTWMTHLDMRSGTAYDKLLHDFSKLKLIGPEAVEKIRLDSRENFAKTKVEFTTLFKYNGGTQLESALVFPIVEGTPLKLSKERENLLNALDNFIEQPFMRTTVGDGLDPTAKGTLVLWNNEKLDKAAKLNETRKKYLTDDLPKFPQTMQASVRELIDYQFSLLLVDIVSQSFTIETTEVGHLDDRLAQNANFEATSAHLKKIGMMLKETGQDEQLQKLQTIVANDASARLKSFSAELVSARLYSLGDSDGDDGRSETKGTLSVFGVGTQQDLPDYLARQFGKIDALTTRALTYRAALPMESRNTPELTRWAAIATDIELYKAKDPKSSLGKLERFLLDMGRDLDAPSCMAALKLHEPVRRPGNYFAERQQDLHRVITRRCMALDRRSFVDQWAVFSTDFNRGLKGRRPFTGSRPTTAKLGEYNEIASADIAEVSAALSHLPAVSPEVLARSLGNESATLPIRDVALQFAAVRQLMAPLFPSDPALPAGFDVQAKFRINTAAEIGGNKIIDWTLSIGEQTIKLRDPPKPLRWKPGASVRLTLRFANDVPLNPQGDTSNPFLYVSKKTASFHFEGPWALLDMIQLLRLDDSLDTRTQLLRLELPVAPADPKDPVGKDKVVRVFAGLIISEPGKTAPLAWPRVFPDRAPALDR